LFSKTGPRKAHGEERIGMRELREILREKKRHIQQVERITKFRKELRKESICSQLLYKFTKIYYMGKNLEH
jgi:hypothetical protein